MKKLIFNSAIALIIMLAGSTGLFAQTDKPYDNGPLWEVQFVHTKAGMGDQYLKNLSEGWIKEMKEAKAQGLIMDYKVLSAQPASENDWNLMLLYEVKNYAALDGMTDKMDNIGKKLFGNEDSQHKMAVSRNDLRVLDGGKLTQELDFK